MSALPADATSVIAPEDAARANVYALLARLWYAPPDRALLARLAAADEIAAQGEGEAFADSWRALKAAAASIDEDAARAGFDALYVGPGKAQVPPYAGAYLGHGSPQRFLVALRQDLGQHGLARQHGVHEPEDHIAALCDVMRHLMSAPDAALHAQREFFMRYLHQPARGFCDATEKADGSGFYRAVAGLARAFFEIEHTMFEMD